MTDPRFPEDAFHKAAGSGTVGGVEVAIHRSGVGVRDSKDKAGPLLVFTPHEWDVFLDGVRKGEFDRH